MKFDKREGVPVGKSISMILSERLRLDGLLFISMALMENTYETFDSIIYDPFKTPNQQGYFYTAHDTLIANQPRMILNP